jgi:hypothetical protein
MTPNRRTSLEVIVPIVGLSYFASFAIGLTLRSAIANGALAQYQLFFIPLAAFSALSALAVWLKPRTGFIAAALMSVALMAIFFLTRDGNDVITVLSNPARNYLQFAFYITAVPQFFTTLASSAIGLWRSYRTGRWSSKGTDNQKSLRPPT